MSTVTKVSGIPEIESAETMLRRGATMRGSWVAWIRNAVSLACGNESLADKATAQTANWSNDLDTGVSLVARQLARAVVGLAGTAVDAEFDALRGYLKSAYPAAISGCTFRVASKQPKRTARYDVAPIWVTAEKGSRFAVVGVIPAVAVVKPDMTDPVTVIADEPGNSDMTANGLVGALVNQGAGTASEAERIDRLLRTERASNSRALKRKMRALYLEASVMRETIERLETELTREKAKAAALAMAAAAPKRTARTR